MASLATIIISVRTLLQDTTTSRRTEENLRLQVDGTNKVFRMHIRNIVTGTLTVNVDGTDTTPASTDLVNGEFTMTSAPSKSCTARCNYTLGTDTEYTEAVNSGMQMLGYTTITDVPDVALPALYDFAAHQMARGYASLSAWFYSASVAGKNVQKSEVAKAWLELSKDFLSSAMRKRENVYTRQDQPKAPYSAHAAMSFNPNYMPRR